MDICRRNGDWNTILPAHLHIVMQKLETEEGSSALLSIGQVSKAWLAAFRSYPWSYKLEMRDRQQLTKLAQLLPGMTSLSASTNSLGCFKLKPLSQLSLLSSVELIGKEYRTRCWYEKSGIQPLVKLYHLPAAAKELKMKDVYADPTCFEGIKCTGHTKLSMEWEQNSINDVAELLEHLPALKVITSLHLKYPLIPWVLAFLTLCQGPTSEY